MTKPSGKKKGTLRYDSNKPPLYPTKAQYSTPLHGEMDEDVSVTSNGSDQIQQLNSNRKRPRDAGSSNDFDWSSDLQKVLDDSCNKLLEISKQNVATYRNEQCMKVF